MSKLATLRVTIPVDDAVKVEDVQIGLRNMLRSMPAEPVLHTEKNGQTDIERGVVSEQA